MMDSTAPAMCISVRVDKRLTERGVDSGIIDHCHTVC